MNLKVKSKVKSAPRILTSNANETVAAPRLKVKSKVKAAPSINVNANETMVG